MKRENLPKKVQLEVWKRDNWHCRYCGEPAIFAPTLKLLEKLNPKHMYYHPNGKEGKMLTLFARKWASVDHVKPVSAGGKDEMDNYVTACWGCNNTLREKISKNGKPKPITKSESKWDGLSGVYPKLLELVGGKEDAWPRLIKGD